MVWSGLSLLKQPHSWREVDRVLKGVPEADRCKMQYENAVRLYKIDAVLPDKD